MSAILPTPTGRYAVGRCRFDLVDGGRADPFARRRGTPRKLPLVAWYPADTVGRSGASYLPGAWRTTSWMWGLDAGRTRTHAVDDATPLESVGGFPLVVFSPSANSPLVYAALLEQIASHGYVVVGIAHPYESMPLTVYRSGWPRLTRPASLGGALATPGRRPFGIDLAERAAVVDVKADDIGFTAAAVIDGAAMPVRLPVDPSRWAAIGHSFGGGAAAEIGRRGTTCLAGASLDGGLWRAPESAAVDLPFLQLFGEHPEYTTPIAELVENGHYANDEYAAEDRATTVGAWQVLHESSADRHCALVVGATHTAFTDWPLLPLRSWSPARRVLAGSAGTDVWAATSNVLLAFLDQYVGTGRARIGVALGAIAALRPAAPADLFAGPHPALVD